MIRLTPGLVQDIFRTCLFREGEPQSQRLEVAGIISTFVLHRSRIQGRCGEIEAMLRELPVQFRLSVGGGQPFGAACIDRHGHQWTGEHRVVEQLFVLGMAIGKAEFLAPIELWTALTGGMPVIVIDM